MAFKDIFKKKQEEKKQVKAVKEKKEVKKEIKKEKPVSPVSEVVSRPLKKKERTMNHGPVSLRSLHVTEKASDLLKDNRYVFKVFPEANKTEIKKSIESLYGVNVINVRTINVPRKARRMGKQTGWRKGYKKAIIKIKEGQKIEVLAR